MANHESPRTTPLPRSLVTFKAAEMHMSGLAAMLPFCVPSGLLFRNRQADCSRNSAGPTRIGFLIVFSV
jgi:hypothetical protein